MSEKAKGYPQYDGLFDAADISYLANEDVITYSASRMKLEDDKEGLIYYGEQEWKKGMEKGMEKGIKEGERSMLKDVVERLKNKGFSLHDIVDMLNISVSEIQTLL